MSIPIDPQDTSARYELPITEEDQNLIARHSANGLQRLSLIGDEDEIMIIERIGAEVDRQREAMHIADEDTAAAFILEMAYLWGIQVCRAYSWEWVHPVINGLDGGAAVVSPDRSIMCNPFKFIYQFVVNVEQETTVVLLFNMLAPTSLSRLLPNVKPRSYYPVN
jgi:hypothetical protein